MLYIIIQLCLINFHNISLFFVLLFFKLWSYWIILLHALSIVSLLRTSVKLNLFLHNYLPHSVLFYLWMVSNQNLSLKGSFGYKDGLASYQQRHGRSYVLGSGWGRRMLWATTEHHRPPWRTGSIHREAKTQIPWQIESHNLVLVRLLVAT